MEIEWYKYMKVDTGNRKWEVQAAGTGLGN